MPSVARLLQSFESALRGEVEPLWRLDNILGHDAALMPGGILCCFGSREPLDWLKNLLALPAPYRGTRFHAGFLEEALAIASASPSRPAAVIGFSRGAAVAAILSYHWTIPALALACPRYLWRLAPRPAAPVVHVGLLLDPVPRVPLFTFRRFAAPSLWLPGWRHDWRTYVRAARRNLGRLEQCFATMRQRQSSDVSVS